MPKESNQCLLVKRVKVILLNFIDANLIYDQIHEESKNDTKRNGH